MQLDSAAQNTNLFRLAGTVECDPAVGAWFAGHGSSLGAVACEWFGVMRACGDEVRERIHDGCPVACLGDAAFGYVNVFTSHANVGFHRGALLRDPAKLLEGGGKLMRHVKLKPGVAVDAHALKQLIEASYAEIKSALEGG